MHYYQFNIGDYSSHTSRLSRFEDLAYRRLLDLYYLNERPFDGCLADVCREVGMIGEEDAVQYVLGKFFPLDGEVWRNKRADKEIAAYKKKRRQAVEAGVASGKARRDKGSEQTSSVRSADDEPNINHKPLTTNHKPKKRKEVRDLPLFLSRETWDDFVEHRIKVKSPMTEKAETMLIKKLASLHEAGEDVDQLLNDAIINGWKSVYPEKGGSSGQGNQRKSLSAPEKVRAAIRERDAKQAKVGNTIEGEIVPDSP